MSNNHDEKETPFKVVDKRRFTEVGDERVSFKEEEEKKSPFKNEPIKTAPEKLPMSFSLFVQSLVHQAMMGMGLIAWPDSGLIKKDLSLSQQTIDILMVLQEKTKGNLTKEEQDFLDGVLYQLRVAYIELAKCLPPTGDILIK